ncbi:MAG: hypothetical protein ACKOUM_02190, partial [Sphingopyxis sp.]
MMVETKGAQRSPLTLPFGAWGVGGIMAAISGVAGVLTPTRLLESLSFQLYLDLLTDAAKAPLGVTAHLLFGIALAAIGGIVGYAIARLLGVRATPGGFSGLLERLRGARPADEADAPPLRAADRHPDAPARRPFSAARDIPGRANSATAWADPLADDDAQHADDDGMAMLSTPFTPSAPPAPAVAVDAGHHIPLPMVDDEDDDDELLLGTDFAQPLPGVMQEDPSQFVDLPAPRLSDWDDAPAPAPTWNDAPAPATPHLDAGSMGESVSQSVSQSIDAALPAMVADAPPPVPLNTAPPAPPADLEPPATIPAATIAPEPAAPWHGAAELEPVYVAAPPTTRPGLPAHDPLDLSAARLDELLSRLESGLTRRGAVRGTAVAPVVDGAAA